MEIDRLENLLKQDNIPYLREDYQMKPSNTWLHQISIMAEGVNVIRASALQFTSPVTKYSDTLEMYQGLTQRERALSNTKKGMNAEECYKRLRYCYYNKTRRYKELEE